MSEPELTAYDAIRDSLSSDAALFVEFSAELGLWGVWADGEIIGAAVNRYDALCDALGQIQAWELAAR